jgi:hypothetical protein
MLNDKFEVQADAAAATGGSISLTWTASEPTAVTTQTIATGASMTGAEVAIYVASINAQLTKVLADVAAIRTLVNA